MANQKHPYAPGNGGLIKTVAQLRKSFPAEVTAATLKKLGFAPQNESYVIGILRFIGVIDDKGNRTAAAGEAFSKHSDKEFHEAFSGLVEAAYSELFKLHGAAAWALPVGALISFFRGHDQTSSLVGQRQASTFKTLASLAGHGSVAVPNGKPAPAKKAVTVPRSAKPAPVKLDPVPPVSNFGEKDRVGLTVRVEINLPATGDQATYDRIFKSIRENLLRG